MGRREISFSKHVYIERDDFMMEPTEDFFRLGPGREVRLRYAYAITCEQVITDDAGQVTELICRYDPDSGGGKTLDGRKIRGIIHWVNAADAVDATVRVYDRLFSDPNPAVAEDFISLLNPDSLSVFEHAKLEAGLADADPQDRFQFERVGYFCFDERDHDAQAGQFVLNRTVSLRDTWSKK